ncbi:MAG: universal stress protein [Desulfobacterales bacterium]
MLPINKIICPTDFSDPSYEGLKTAAELAGNFGAELILVHVVMPMPSIIGAGAPTGFHIPSVLEKMEKEPGRCLRILKREDCLKASIPVS